MGKGGKGYILKNWVVHRGRGSLKVNKTFRNIVKFAGTENEHRLPKMVKMRLQAGGARYAAMGNYTLNNRR